MSGVCASCKAEAAEQYVLVIANSGRMLANAVKQAGYRPLVIDLFADQDTEEIADTLWQVDNLSLSVVQDVVECLLLNYKIQWLIYGSGLEGHLDTLEYLMHHFNVMGNNAAVFKQFKHKQSFFKQLDVLGIHHPEIQFELPGNKTEWLIKPSSHAGGLGIGWCNREIREDEYYQKFCQGQAGSVLFCADGEQFDLIGFHRQWTVSRDNFVFAGMIRDAFLAQAQQLIVQCWLKKLVAYYHLKGLASLDFIWDGEACHFLEINPRPPASMLLYPELDLLTAHRTGRLQGAVIEEKVCAIQIIYAGIASKIKQNRWPGWSSDWPKINTSIQAGEPICSIMAQEKTVQQTLDSLLEKQYFIENNFIEGIEHNAIHSER